MHGGPKKKKHAFINLLIKRKIQIRKQNKLTTNKKNTYNIYKQNDFVVLSKLYLCRFFKMSEV